MRCSAVSSLITRIGLLTVCLLGGFPVQAQLATIDWTVAETLIALDAPIVGGAQKQAYHEWVGEPRLPDEAADLGLRSQPNMELLAKMQPERTLISPMFAGLTPRLERIAPVTSVELYTPGSDTWQEMQSITEQIGELADRAPQAAQLIEQTHSLMARLRDERPDTAPLLMIQFMDARHVRVFGDNSLYNAVLEQLALPNAWDQATNAWGFSLVGVEELARYPDAALVIVDPLPTGVEAQLAESGLWQQLPSVKNDRLLRLPPVWSFGALPSAQRFAKELVAALEDAPQEALSPK
ncbi:ABC transporter substrate-binding protein [Halomonas janggokensis]|uniref:ABC transporter substrate-binding protein n=1 Tax=Vreelandella janggokensis TaxID=370767 RepID=A0ABT4IUS1_9GAMM|nr:MULTISPECIES: ABC transporter substrate-binding protein [Halomonas]MCZ0927422.1 ABC transporter substrate-binding protein [Halomonas janggokensis]MCZ0929930.1 ABC transporter substrate-binding protein [Halomonas janggokensis]